MEKSPKYKIVGFLDLLLGIFQVAIPSIQLIFVYPKLHVLYTDFGVKLDPVTTYGPVSFIALVGIVNLFLSVKLLKKSKDNKEGYFKLGVAVAIISLLLTLPLISLSLFGFLFSIYHLTSSF